MVFNANWAMFPKQREVRELKDHVKDTKDQAARKIREAKQAAGINNDDDIQEKLQEVSFLQL